MLETHADEIHELATFFVHFYIYIFCKTLLEQALHALNMLMMYPDMKECVYAILNILIDLRHMSMKFTMITPFLCQNFKIPALFVFPDCQ